MEGKAWPQEHRAVGTSHPQSRHRKTNVGAQLASSFLSNLDLKSTGWCCPHSDLVFPHQLSFSKSTPTNISRDVFPW